MKSPKLKIGITHGDINGINYEILLRLLADKELLELGTPIVYGSAKVAAYWRKALQLDLEPWHRIDGPQEAVVDHPNLINCIDDAAHVKPGETTLEAGGYALDALELAMEHLLNGEIDALVTAPIHKSGMPKDRFPYKGHTDYLAARCPGEGHEGPMMILHNGNIRVALSTIHLPLTEVAANIKQETICSQLKQLDASLRRDFGVDSPRIAVLALNPHAGDNGLLGQEEINVISPAIEQACQEYGVAALGPFAADGFWGSRQLHLFDAVLAMYHDQGLAPFKALCMGNGVNFTANMPFVRTSPDHGTGHDIVLKGEATVQSFRHAFYSAIDIVRHRRFYDECRANPLPRYYRDALHDSDTSTLEEQK